LEWNMSQEICNERRHVILRYMKTFIKEIKCGFEN
jgi:hypothetical protein